MDSMSLDDLRNLRTQIDRAISSYETRRRKEAMAALERTAREMGFNLNDLTGAQARGRRGAAAAAVGWVLPVLVLSSRRPEGDLVVPATATGYAWLLGGFALAVAGVVLPYPRPVRRTAEPSAPPGDGR